MTIKVMSHIDRKAFEMKRLIATLFCLSLGILSSEARKKAGKFVFIKIRKKYFLISKVAMTISSEV